jgi:hypothetical protein
MPRNPRKPILAALADFCNHRGPTFTSDELVDWINRRFGFESPATLLAYARRIKARQIARKLTCFDPETRTRVPRLWPVADPRTGEPAFADITQLPPETRRRLIQTQARLQAQLRTLQRALEDSTSGQGLFEFYTDCLTSNPDDETRDPAPAQPGSPPDPDLEADDYPLFQRPQPHLTHARSH